MDGAAKPMTVRVVIVTGASAGIGKATAAGLAALGAHVVMPCRDEPKCKAAMGHIGRAVPDASLEMMCLDLASLEDVRRFADEFRATHRRLDVLINNAAVVKRRRELTVDGLEETFAVNVLAPFLLTNLLLPMLRASAPSRIINLSSGLHKRAHMDLGDLQLDRGWSSYRAYDRSKLADILLTVALAETLRGTGVTANSAHPGLIDSDLGREMSWMQRKVKHGRQDLRLPGQLATGRGGDRPVLRRLPRGRALRGGPRQDACGAALARVRGAHRAQIGLEWPAPGPVAVRHALNIGPRPACRAESLGAGAGPMAIMRREAMS